MKKILLISTLLASVCFAEDTYAEYEAKRQQMQEHTMTQENQGSGEQKKYRKGNENAGSTGPQDGTGNMYKGSNGSGGGGGGGGRGRR